MRELVFFSSTPTTGGEAARGDERSVMWRGDEGMREGSEDSKIHLPALTHLFVLNADL